MALYKAVIPTRGGSSRTIIKIRAKNKTEAKEEARERGGWLLG